MRRVLLLGTGIVLACLVVLLAGCGDKPVAFVNGEKITQKELMDQLETLGGHQVLHEMIVRRLLEDEAKNLGLVPTDQEIDAAMGDWRKQFPDEATFIAYLARRNMTPETLRERIRFEMLQRKLAEKDVKYTEDDLRKFFRSRKDLYDKPERVLIQEIMTFKQEEAQKVYELVTTPGTDFDGIARQYNMNPETQATAGKRPLLAKNQLFPLALRKPAFTLKVGTVSKPIQANGHWYVIRVLDRLPAEKAQFDKLRKDVERDYKAQHAKDFNEVLNAIKAKAQVQIVSPKYADVAEAFRTSQLPEWGQPGQPSKEAAPAGNKPAKQSGGGAKRPAPKETGGP